MENENVPKQFNIDQNILKILTSVENANINNQWKFHVSTIICVKVKPNAKFDFAWKFPFFLNFSFVFLSGAFENYWEF